jgi:hypothetical protein
MDKNKGIDKQPGEEQVRPAPPNDNLFDRFSKLIEEAQEQTGEWRGLQEKWHKMRMRIKPAKTFPFPGCANLRLPTIETKLRKIKSQLVKIIFGIRPIVQAIPSPSGNLQTAMKVEKWLDHLIMDKMNFKPKAVIAIDQSIEKGLYLFKPYWRQEIITRMEEYSLKDLSMQEVQQLYSVMTTPDMIKQELINRLEVDMSDLVAEENDKELDRVISEIQSGKDKIKLELKDVLWNFPDVALGNPEFIYVPSDSPYSPQDCRMVTHEFFLPYDTVNKNVESKKWSREAVDSIWAWNDLTAEQLSQTEVAKETREGISRLNNPSKLVRIWETYCWYDLNGDGEEEKCVFTFAPDFGVTLRKITLPFFNGKFPFVKLVNELCDDRWFSHRGLPEMIEDLVKEVDTQHNQKIDSQTLRNAPMVTYRAGIVNPNLIKFVPSQAIPRQSPDDVVFMNNTNLNAEFSYKDEQMILEMKIEELIGQIDFGLQSMVNRRQPRTAYEVGQQGQSAQLVFSLDADTYTEAFSELFSMVWDLWCQYGNDQEEFMYFGENGWEKIRLTREEVQGKYKIVVRGNDSNFNPQVRQQKAGMIMQATLNPIAIQSGVIQPKNLYNVFKKFYQTLDETAWMEFITDPSTIPSQPPPPPPIKLGAENLTPSELAQVKMKQGVQPDVRGMAMMHQDQHAKEALDAEEQKTNIVTQIAQSIQQRQDISEPGIEE